MTDHIKAAADATIEEQFRQPDIVTQGCGCTYDARTYDTLSFCKGHKKKFPRATAEIRRVAMPKLSMDKYGNEIKRTPRSRAMLQFKGDEL